MEQPQTTQDKGKYAAAAAALAFVEPGMKLGLGTGSTAAWLVRLLGQRMKDEGFDVTAVATSSATVALAVECGIKTTTLDSVGRLDMTIDGADEFDPDFNLIKGAGAALLQEKIVAASSDRMVVIADVSKRVEHLGAFPLPVEVVQFGWQTTRNRICAALEVEGLAGDVILRRKHDQPLITDEAHFLLDLQMGQIPDPGRIDQVLNHLPGVVETGLFCGMADTIVIGLETGKAQILRKE